MYFINGFMTKKQYCKSFEISLNDFLDVRNRLGSGFAIENWSS